MTTPAPTRLSGHPVRILLVEDEPDKAERLERAAGDGNSDADIAVAASAAEARTALEGGERDLVVLGLSEGMDLFGEIRREHPGTQVIVHAGPEALGEINELLALVRQEDPYGTETPRQMVSFFADEELESCADAVHKVVGETARVASLPLTPTEKLQLSTSQARAIQIFARRTGAARADVTPLSGGLSGAVTVVVDATDESGMQTAHVVGKLAGIATIPSAVDGYENAIPNLPAGLGAALAGVVMAGAGDTGATFYRLADDYRRSWFECLESSPADAAETVKRLHGRFAEDYARAPIEPLPLGTIRRAVISDEELATAVAPYPEIEHLQGVEIEARRWIPHRDLHGLNVLVSDSNEPLLIDYDNYGVASCAIDPMTLELSAVFHRDETAQRARKGWPSPEAARSWTDLDAYLEGCPYPEAIRACRVWAADAAASRAEMAATLLSIGIRQFWFDNTDKELAAAFVEAGIAALP